MFRGGPDRMQAAYRRHIQRIPTLFDTLDVPAIAAVNGTVIGAGMDLACMCDIRIAGSGAKFAESFLRVGLISGDGGAWYLPRVLGYAKAIELALTCRTLDAIEATAWGVVSRAVEADTLVAEALATAQQIAQFPPRSIRLNKRSSGNRHDSTCRRASNLPLPSRRSFNRQATSGRPSPLWSRSGHPTSPTPEQSLASSSHESLCLHA